MPLEVDIEPKGGPVELFRPETAEYSMKAKVFSWLPREEIEDGTLRQISNIARLPNAVAVAVMPDAHKGYGMPIGTALATEGAVVPYAVGVDIGCGMVAVELGLKVADVSPVLRPILEGIYKRVPVGQPTKKDRNQGQFTERQNSTALREWVVNSGLGEGVSDQLRERADRQLGTLGGGNHFIELQADETDNVWLMLHTGSRGFGYAIGQAYYKRALEWCTRYHTPLPDKELAFLSLETEDGQAYLRDMRYAMRFAEESRARIEKAALEVIFGADAAWSFKYEMRRIETHHNFAAIEQHFGKKVVVHRKGAVKTTSTWDDKVEPLPASVTIPGSMQTGSYIGVGNPNKLAMNTCSHGAGRAMGRKAFVRDRIDKGQPLNIRLEMDAQGIELVCPDDGTVLDEAGGAYKDIESVMKYQADLVTPVVKLRPLGVVKG